MTWNPKSKDDLLEWAWTIIANAGGGDWEKESKDWQEVAPKWRDAYFKMVDASPNLLNKEEPK